MSGAVSSVWSIEGVMMRRRTETPNTKLVKKVKLGGWRPKDVKPGRKRHNDR